LATNESSTSSGGNQLETLSLSHPNLLRWTEDIAGSSSYQQQNNNKQKHDTIMYSTSRKMQERFKICWKIKLAYNRHTCTYIHIYTV